MATIITPPAPYSSVKEPLIFGIDRDSNEAFEVEVNGYKKVVPGKTSALNVANYFRGRFDILPLNEVFYPEIEFFIGYYYDRVAEAMISVDGVNSEWVPIICADKRPAANRFMSDLRRRTIMRGQIDEIPVYATAPAVVVYGSTKVSVPVDVSFAGFRIPDDAPERFAVELQTPDGEVLDRIEYEIGKSCGARLAWINAYGAIDYWNFDSRRKTATKIAKEKIYTEYGYLPTSMQVDTTHTVASRPLPEELTDALCRIFVSEGVWFMENGMARPIDITSESVTTYEAGKLTSVQVEYRNKIREL